MSERLETNCLKKETRELRENSKRENFCFFASLLLWFSGFWLKRNDAAKRRKREEKREKERGAQSAQFYFVAHFLICCCHLQRILFFLFFLLQYNKRAKTPKSNEFEPNTNQNQSRTNSKRSN